MFNKVKYTCKLSKLLLLCYKDTYYSHGNKFPLSNDEKSNCFVTVIINNNILTAEWNENKFISHGILFLVWIIWWPKFVIYGTLTGFGLGGIKCTFTCSIAIFGMPDKQCSYH